MAVSLPFVLILMDRIFFTKDLKKCIITQIPYLFISVLFFITSMIVITSGDLSTGSDKLEIFQRILLVLYLFIFYIYKLFIPLNLSARYPIEINELLPTPIWTLLLIPILFFLLLLFFSKDKKNVTFGILFFLITLLPITPLIFLGFPYGDRYSYIPSIGIFYIFGAVINYLLQKKTRFFIIKKVCIAVGIAAIILFLTVQTRKHSKIWENNFTLWNNVIKTNPTNAIGYNNRGVEYLKTGYQREAMMDFRKALERNPNHVKTHNNIGIIFLETKDYRKAIYFFTIAVKLNPNYSDAYFNRGCAWGNLKNFEKAINDFSTAIKINPKFIKAYYYRAITYERLKMFEKAKHDFQKIYKLDPNFPLKKTFEYKNGKPGKTGSVFLRLDLEDKEFS
jgi:tetratricopeptide (TPR) repeat protein